MSAATPETGIGASASSVDELETFERMWQSELSRIVQADAGRELAKRIAKSPSSIVVLYGPERSGKTEFISSIVPLLSTEARVVHRASLEEDADQPATTGRVIEIWEHIDQMIGHEPSRSRFVEYCRSVAGSTERLVVLVVSDGHLRELLSLRNALPSLLDDVIEMPIAAPQSVVAQLPRLLADFGIQLPSNLLACVHGELEEASSSGPLTSALLTLLAFELWRDHSAGQLNVEHYRASGGLHGALARVLEFMCERVAARRELSWAVLDAVAQERGAGQERALRDLALRFDVEDAVPAEVHNRLVARHLLVQMPAGDYALVTDQLLSVVQAWHQRMSDATHLARTILRQGARLFSEHEALLSEAAFLKVHAQRTAMPSVVDEARLMLRCSLAYADDQHGAAAHWLRRLPDASVAAELLLEGSFDARAEVRARCLYHMRQMPQQEIKNRLHTLALSDPAQEVRSAAVLGLAAVAARDASIRADLLAEMEAANTPYRLQAVEALRAYPDIEVVQRLRELVRRNAPGEDGHARAAAIAVLGFYGSLDSAEALLDVALHDQDGEDRDAATAALSGMRRAEVADQVLARLRASRPSMWPRALRRFASWRDAAPALAAANLAAAATVFVHGTSLATLRRWKQAIAVTVFEVASVCVMTVRAEWGVTLFLASLLAGVLLPARSLWLELEAGQPLEHRSRERANVPPTTGRPSFSERYRYWLGWMLVLSLPLSLSLFLHGLFCVLVKRYWRAISCLGVELLGLMLVWCGMYWEQELELYATLTSAFTLIPTGFQYVGWTLFCISWCIDLATVIWQILLRREARRTDERIDAITSHVTGNPLVVARLSAALRATAPSGDAKWAIRLLQRHEPNEGFRALIERLWSEEDAHARKVLINVLARRRDGTSLEILRARDPQDRWRGRLRYFFARVALARALLPKGTFELMCVLGASFFSAAYLLFVQNAHRPDRLQAAILDPASNSAWVMVVGSEQEAARKLARLVSIGDEPIGHAALSSVAVVFRKLRTEGDDEHDAIKLAMLEELTKSAFDVKDRAESQIFLEDAVAESLGNSKLHEPALKALASIDTAASVGELIAHVDGLARSPKNLALNGNAAQTTIRALAAIRGQDVERLRAFLRWQDELSFGEVISGAAKNAFDSAPIMAKASFFLERAVGTEESSPESLPEADFKRALGLAQSAKSDPTCDAACQRQARGVIARVHGRLGLLAYEHSKAERDSGARAAEYANAKSHLESVLAVIDAAEVALPSDASEDVLTLGLALGFVEHEEVALYDTKGYQRNYEWLLTLKSIALGLGDGGWSATIDGNLAEASVTTGHYGDALKIARELPASVQAQGLDARNIGVNMKLVELVALIFLGKSSEVHAAELQLKPLIAQSTLNTWSYRGLRSYVERSNLSAQDKLRVSNALKAMGH